VTLSLQDQNGGVGKEKVWKSSREAVYVVKERVGAGEPWYLSHRLTARLVDYRLLAYTDKSMLKTQALLLAEYFQSYSLKLSTPGTSTLPIPSTALALK
jgi:hypothetical protein